MLRAVEGETLQTRWTVVGRRLLMRTVCMKGSVCFFVRMMKEDMCWLGRLYRTQSRHREGASWCWVALYHYDSRARDALAKALHGSGSFEGAAR